MQGIFIFGSGTLGVAVLQKTFRSRLGIARSGLWFLLRPSFTKIPDILARSRQLFVMANELESQWRDSLSEADLLELIHQASDVSRNDIPDAQLSPLGWSAYLKAMGATRALIR